MDQGGSKKIFFFILTFSEKQEQHTIKKKLFLINGKWGANEIIKNDLLEFFPPFFE